MAKTLSQRVLLSYIVAKTSCQHVLVGYIRWRNTSNQRVLVWLYKVAKNIESTCFGRLYKVAKTSSQRVLVS